MVAKSQSRTLIQTDDVANYVVIIGILVDFYTPPFVVRNVVASDDVVSASIVNVYTNPVVRNVVS